MKLVEDFTKSMDEACLAGVQRTLEILEQQEQSVQSRDQWTSNFDACGDREGQIKTIKGRDNALSQPFRDTQNIVRDAQKELQNNAQEEITRLENIDEGR